MKQISIRLATKSDIPDLLSLAGLADLEDGVGRIPSTTAESLTRSLFAPGALCGALVADREGPIVGVAHFHQFWPAVIPNPILALDDLFVVDDYRQHGVGTKLVTELCRLGLEFDCAHLDFTVRRNNRGALKFYRKLGAIVFSDVRLCRYNREAMEQLAEELE
ncbi:MAG: GNAT family N-acetyltransferase [Verrucomicrobiota bacterium]